MRRTIHNITIASFSKEKVTPKTRHVNLENILCTAHWPLCCNAKLMLIYLDIYIYLDMISRYDILDIYVCT